MYVIHPGVSKSGEYGLGNQMFQIASAIGIAKSNQGDFRLSSPWHNGKYFKNQLPVLSNILKEPLVVKEKSFDYSPITLPSDRAVIYLDGYFQSWKYFKDIFTEISHAFTIKDEIVEDVQKLLAHLGTTCSISVRRGDYVRLQHIHPLQPDDYWIKAQSIIESKVNIDTYVVFSDDIQWCRENKQLFTKTNKKVVFFSGRTQMDDFTAITLCNCNIITNSTFSWWGAYLNLNLNNIVVMPEIWFGPVGPWSGPSTANDLHFPDWYRI